MESMFASCDPTRPQPTTITFMGCVPPSLEAASG
jgi:hypothetical protein